MPLGFWTSLSLSSTLPHSSHSAGYLLSSLPSNSSWGTTQYSQPHTLGYALASSPIGASTQKLVSILFRIIPSADQSSRSKFRSRFKNPFWRTPARVRIYNIGNSSTSSLLLSSPDSSQLEIFGFSALDLIYLFFLFISLCGFSISFFLTFGGFPFLWWDDLIYIGLALSSSLLLCFSS